MKESKTVFIVLRLWLLLAVLVSFACPVGGAEYRRGDVVFEMDFEDSAAREKWSRAVWAVWVPDGRDGSTVLRCDVPVAEAGEGKMIRMPFDLTPYRGMKLQLQCMARAENVTKPPHSYNGVKFMLHYKSASFGPHWNNEGGVDGTFDWRKFSYTSFITEDAEGGVLYLGLQGSSGKVWFDDIQVTVVRGRPLERPAPMLNPPPVYKGHNLPRLRGMMSNHTFSEENMRVLGQEWNANLIRWQITRNWGKANTDRDLAEYDRWLDGKLADLDKGLESCARHGIKVLIDLHSPPGGRYENKDMAMFFEPLYQDHFVKVWERMARRYKGNKTVWGYDLVNEPVQGKPSPAGIADYWGAQIRAAKAVRAI